MSDTVRGAVDRQFNGTSSSCPIHRVNDRDNIQVECRRNLLHFICIQHTLFFAFSSLQYLTSFIRSIMSSTAASSSSTPVKAKKPVSPIVTAYLLAYNLIAAASWAYVLYLIVNHFAIEGKKIETLFDVIHQPLYFAQSLAILEVLHSLFRLVSSPVFTTAMQVYSRLQLVWGIFYLVPDSRYHLGFVLAATVSSLTSIERKSGVYISSYVMIIALTLSSFFVLSSFFFSF